MNVAGHPWVDDVVDVVEGGWAHQKGGLRLDQVWLVQQDFGGEFDPGGAHLQYLHL